MDGPQHRPIGAGFPQGRNGGVKLSFGNLGQHFFSKERADFLQFSGNGGVFVRQVGVACLTVNDAQGMAAGGKIEVHRLDDGMLPVKEINGYQIAYGRGGLIHQAAGLAEEDILGVLADLGDFRLGNLPVKKQPIDNGADQHLEGGGGAEAGTGEHGGFAVGIKAGNGTPQLRESGANTPHQRRGGVDFISLGGEGLQRNGAQGIALGENPYGIGAVCPYSRLGIQIHGSGQHPAPLMVRVIAADFGTSGSGEIPLGFLTKLGNKPLVQDFFLRFGKNKAGC